MGSISAEKLLPPQWIRPDDALPIGTLEVPKEVTAMCVGFNRRSGDEIFFEGETPLFFRWSERLWRYRYPGKDGGERISQRFRLEIIADPNHKDFEKRSHLCPGNKLVVVREPYGSNWVQTTTFRMYSKKETESKRKEMMVPQLDDKKKDPVEWLERNLEDLKYDPWETDARYVAGISVPNGYREEVRNITGKFVFGACPDVDGLLKDIFATREIRKLLEQTKANTIVFAHPDAGSDARLTLYPEVIEMRDTLMWRSIEQALAGPSKPYEGDPQGKWVGQPVSELVRRIYCDHLNDYNRREWRQLKHEVPAGYDLDRHGKSAKDERNDNGGERHNELGQ
jgi:hypothetical protein